MRKMRINEIKGRTVYKIIGAEKYSERIIIICTDGSEFLLAHTQECCEEVTIEDIEGDLADIIGCPIIRAEEVSNSGSQPSVYAKNDDEEDIDRYEYTWTFYKIDTQKGGVNIRWFGKSNGCYSERVECYKIK